MNITDDFFVGDHPNLMRKVSFELTLNILNRFVALLVPNLVFLNAGTGAHQERVLTTYKRLRGSPIAKDYVADSKPTHHPTYPDFEFIQQNAQYPTTYPTYSSEFPTIYPSYPSLRPTSRKTASPTLQLTPSSQAPTTGLISQDSSIPTNFNDYENWVPIIDEDFENNILDFLDQENPTMYYNQFEGRTGVVAMQDGSDDLHSYVVSRAIALGESIGYYTLQSTFKVVMSIYPTENSSEFCFDYSVDDGITWHLEKCWLRDVDFADETWHDDISIVFEPENRFASLKLRFRATSSSGLVLMDSLQLSDLHD